MKKKFFSLFAATLCSSSLLFGDATTLVDIALLQKGILKTCPGNNPVTFPFGVMGRGLAVGKADIKREPGNKIGYSEAEADVVYSHKLSYSAGASYFAGYDVTTINWNDNPFFKKKSFQSVDLGALFYTTRAHCWFWQGGVSVQVDSKASSFGLYHRFTGLLWGRYNYSETIGLHVGTITFLGLRQQVAYPIVGFDYSPSPKWQFNLIFPITFSAAYSLTPSWTLGAGFRPFQSRHREDQSNPIPDAILDYRNYGAELFLDYCSPRLRAYIFSGTSFGGELKVRDHAGRNPQIFRFKSALYGGFNVGYQF